MRDIFVNLKRFEVPRGLGGVCPEENPVRWIQDVLATCWELGLVDLADLRLTFFVPEALIPPAVEASRGAFQIGSQSVFRENISPGGNFGAFTSNLPAAAAKHLGCTWSIIGHSEERRDKLGIMEAFQPRIKDDPELYAQAQSAVNRLINTAVLQALQSGLNVLVCVGETAEERGTGSFAEQKPRIERVLGTQLLESLRGVERFAGEREVVVGYEPIWAIGPGRTLPDGEYISYVAEFIKELIRTELGFEAEVVYGGGLKRENAAMLGSLPLVDGGLVALTRFAGDIGFEPRELKEIVDEYRRGRGSAQ